MFGMTNLPVVLISVFNALYYCGEEKLFLIFDNISFFLARIVENPGMKFFSLITLENRPFKSSLIVMTGR